MPPKDGIAAFRSNGGAKVLMLLLRAAARFFDGHGRGLALPIFRFEILFFLLVLKDKLDVDFLCFRITTSVGILCVRIGTNM